jgi:hypothetical protein
MNIIVSFFLRSLIILYQKLISPLLQPRCRYTPTCSQYGLDAIKKYGPWKGGLLIVKRVFKCHPWGDSGYDPLP